MYRAALMVDPMLALMVERMVVPQEMQTWTHNCLCWCRLASWWVDPVERCSGRYAGSVPHSGAAAVQIIDSSARYPQVV